VKKVIKREKGIYSLHSAGRKVK